MFNPLPTYKANAVKAIEIKDMILKLKSFIFICVLYAIGEVLIKAIFFFSL